METVHLEVFKVVSDILNVPNEEINEGSSPGTLPNWDSLQQINLIMALEEKFDIHFRESQIIGITDVRSIILAVEELQKK